MTSESLNTTSMWTHSKPKNPDDGILFVHLEKMPAGTGLTHCNIDAQIKYWFSNLTWSYITLFHSKGQSVELEKKNVHAIQ